MIISTSVGLFGPYSRYEVIQGCIRTWPPGSKPDAIGADVSLDVIGEYQILDIEVPAGFVSDLYEWNGTELVMKETPDQDQAPQ